MVFVSISSSAIFWKNQLHFGKMEKIQKKLFITLFAEKKQSEKSFDVTFSLERSLHKLRKINESLNPICLNESLSPCTQFLKAF